MKYFLKVIAQFPSHRDSSIETSQPLKGYRSEPNSLLHPLSVHDEAPQDISQGFNITNTPPKVVNISLPD